MLRSFWRSLYIVPRAKHNKAHIGHVFRCWRVQRGPNYKCIPDTSTCPCGTRPASPAGWEVIALPEVRPHPCPCDFHTVHITCNTGKLTFRSEILICSKSLKQGCERANGITCLSRLIRSRMDMIVSIPQALRTSVFSELSGLGLQHGPPALQDDRGDISEQLTERVQG